MHTNISLQQLRYIIEVAECGSINAASQQLYVSQPTLSTTIKDTEQELGISIFNRTNRGITLTNEGTEFIGYARQILQQFDLFEARYSNSNSTAKGRLCVSSQHYAFCVHAFVDLAEECDEEEYNFSLRETRTAEVIDDVKEFRSEIGVLYLSEFNRKVLTKAFSDAGLTFTPLFEAHPHVFVGSNHPLAGRASLKPEDLEEYPRYSFEQGSNNSFFFAEEPLSHLPHSQNITYYDRGTLTILLNRTKREKPINQLDSTWLPWGYLQCRHEAYQYNAAPKEKTDARHDTDSQPSCFHQPQEGWSRCSAPFHRREHPLKWYSRCAD